MKTAISLPDDLFGQAETMAAQLRVSRSELYSRALQEFLARHAPDRITEALDAFYEAFDAPQDQFVKVAAQRTLKQSEW